MVSCQTGLLHLHQDKSKQLAPCAFGLYTVTCSDAYANSTSHYIRKLAGPRVLETQFLSRLFPDSMIAGLHDCHRPQDHITIESSKPREFKASGVRWFQVS